MLLSRFSLSFLPHHSHETMCELKAATFRVLGCCEYRDINEVFAKRLAEKVMINVSKNVRGFLAASQPIVVLAVKSKVQSHARVSGDMLT